MSKPDPAMLKSKDQMVGLSLVMPLATFRKLKAAAGDDMLAWSNHVTRLIEKGTP